MSNQEVDNFTSGGRGASNAAGTLSAGNTVTAFSPASNADNWITQIAPNAYSFSGTQGQTTGATTVNIITLNGADSLSNPKQWYDSNLLARFQQTASGDATGLVARCTDSNHYYRASVTGNNLQIAKDVNGTITVLGSFAFTPGTSKFWIRFLCQGFGFNGAGGVNNLQAKVWLDGNSEPANYQLGFNDASLTAVGYVGLHFKCAATGNTLSVDSFTAIDPTSPLATPAYNVTQNAPYVFTTFVGASSQIMAQQLVTDLTALENGVGNRWQAKWSFVETAQGIYNWAALDDFIYRSNQAGIRTIWPIQAPPTWRQTVDAYGNDSTLNAIMNSGTGYTTATITTLRAGAQLPHQGQLTVDYNTGNAETFYIWNPSGNITAGATSIGISSTKNSQTAFTPAHTHNVGAKIFEATGGPQLANASDFATFAGLAAARYNGTAGYGRVDEWEVENENYDAPAWIGTQSAAWDIGGSVLAPVYYAVRNAILAQYPGVPVIPCAVRKTPLTATTHITNWLGYLISGVQGLGGTLDGIDAHYYRGTTNYDGTLTLDPTLNTYTDATLTVVNTPCIALEISTIKAALATYGVVNAQINVWECGWDLYSGGGGVLTTLSAAVNSGTPITSISVASTPAFIGDGTPIYFDYNNISNNEGPVYAWGNAPLHSTTIQITTNARGSFATQASFTPTKTHAINSQTYAVTDANIVSQALQSQYIQAVADALRTTGCTSVGIFTDNTAATLTTTVFPNTSTSQKSLAWTSGSYTYAQAYTDLKNTYIPAHPLWTGTSNYKNVVLADSPLAYYRLDETSGTVAHDISGNGNNGVLAGVNTYSVAGLIYNDTDMAMTFTANGSVTPPPHLNLTGLSAFSVEYWIQLSAGPQQIVFTQSTTAPTIVYLNGQVYTPGSIASIEIDLYLTYTGSYLSGTLDEISIYNYVLSPTKVLAHYQAGAAPSAPPPAPNTAPPVPLGMKIIMGYVAMTTTDGTSVRIKNTTSDPVPTCSVSIIDNTSSITPQALQELWVLDGNIIPYPSWNLLQGNQFTYGQFTNWFLSGGANINITFLSPPIAAIVASSSTGTELANQNIQQGLVVAGQQYMFSAYLQAMTTLTDFQAILKITWQDAGGNTVGSVLTNQFTPTGSRVRYNVSGTAPAGTVSAQVAFGGVATVAGMGTGTINLDTAQFEPMWFTSQLAYPTPDLTPTSTNARLLPNETIIRQYRKFAGFVTHAIAQDYHGNARTWHIDANGYAWLFDKTFTINSFQNENDLTIIQSLLSFYFPARLDGTTLFNFSGMVPGVTISNLQPNWDDLRTLFNDLASQAGYFWTVDPYWTFVYQPPGFTQMPIQLICDNSTPIDFVTKFPAYNFKQEIDFTQPGASILVIGGNVSTQLTGALTQGNYYTTLQVAPVPAPILSGTVMTLSGAQTVTLSAGARVGATTISVNRFQALFNHGVGATLTSNPYVGNVIDAANSQVYNQQAMYGYGSGGLGIGGVQGGIFMRKVNDSALQSVPDVIARGIAELIQYDNPRYIYHLNTNVELLVGQGVQVTSNTDNLNATTLLISQVTAQWFGTQENTQSLWEYQADLGPVNRSATSILSHIFRQTVKNVSPPGINQTALFLMEKFGITDTA